MCMYDYRIDFRCPRCRKVVRLESDWPLSLDEIVYCPKCNVPAFRLVDTYRESPYKQSDLIIPDDSNDRSPTR